MTDLLVPLATILVGVALPTAIWRWAGVFAAGYLHETSAWLDWVRAVATALIAAVIAKLILYPTGALAEISLLVRLTAVMCGFGVFLAARRNILVGVVVAELILIGGALFGPFPYSP